MTDAIVCSCCQTRKQQLYCPPCLQQGIALHDDLLAKLQAHVDVLIRNAEQQVIRTAVRWRELRADVARREDRCQQLRRFIADREARIALAHSKVRQNGVKARRLHLDSARKSPTSALDNAIERVRLQQNQISHRIRLARHVLVREAVSLFGVRQRSSNQWEIARMVLPPPDAFRVHPSININAALMHLTHLLTLITVYLSIALPYMPTFTTPHIGRPVIRANTPFVTTTKWREKNVLWMSSLASVKPKSTSGIVAKSANKHRQFLTSFALLSFSIAYLAWSQGVPWVGIKENDEDVESDEDVHPRTSSPSVTSATSVLELIFSLAHLSTLGQKSHETGTAPILKHLGFGLDVTKVVQAVLAAEQNAWGTLADGGHELSDEWDLIDGTA